MSEPIPEEQEELEQQENKKFELVEVLENGSIKTFIYRDSEEENKPKSFWSKLRGKNNK